MCNANDDDDIWTAYSLGTGTGRCSGWFWLELRVNTEHY